MRFVLSPTEDDTPDIPGPRQGPQRGRLRPSLVDFDERDSRRPVLVSFTDIGISRQMRQLGRREDESGTYEWDGKFEREGQDRQEEGEGL